MIIVVKIGGACVGAAAKIGALRARGSDVVVVHGAGPQISARCREAGIEPRFVDGLRITDAAVLGIVEEAVAAESARLCGELEAEGVAARPMRDALVAEPWSDPRSVWWGTSRRSSRSASARCWRPASCR